MKTTFSSPTNILSLVAAVSLSLVHSASAVMVTWAGTNGVSATTNWSDVNNWYQINTTTHMTPANNAANFTFWTAVQTPGLITVNVDGAYQSPGTSPAQSYGAFFGQTNGYHTVYIQPGMTWDVQAQNNSQGIGISVGPQQTNNNNINNSYVVTTGIQYTNYTTITGIGGTLFANVGVSTGGLRVEASSSVANNHYSILDMSGLGTFILTNNGGLSDNCYFYVVNNGTNSQALAYLALTNVITPNNAFLVGYLPNSSNSLPIGVYLGQSNYISTGANSNFMAIGYMGCTNGFMQFNPSLLGGSSLPTAYITGTGGNQNAVICSLAGGKVPGYAISDFTGGQVTWIGNNMTLGVSGSASPNTSANGVLTFPNGLVEFNNIVVGDQTVSSGSPAVGTMNVGTNGTLQANTGIVLGAVTGTANGSTGGTINFGLNATLIASSITSGGGGSAINLTNINWTVSLSSINSTNISVGTFAASGPTNIVNIASITPFLGGPYPVRFHLVASPNLTGASTFGLGTLPTSIDPTEPYAGHIDSTTTPGLIDFVLTQGPPSSRSLTWSGTNAGVSDGNWDTNQTDLDWLTSGSGTFFDQYDVVNFTDAAVGATNITMSGTLTPTTVTVSNSLLAYSLGGGGLISGAATLTKLGTNALVLDDSGGNNFTGGMVISNGIVIVGNQDFNGNLGTGPVSIAGSSGVLYFNGGAQSTITNPISGAGTVVQGGGDTLQLAGANTFTGNAIATNSSTLKGGAAGVFGNSSGTVIVASGSTLDPDGIGVSRAITVSGSGINGQGAIINSGGPIYDNPNSGLTPTLNLAADATLSFPSRWDLGSSSGATLSTGGHAYNLTLNGNGYFEWRDVRADSQLANIYLQAGTFGFTGSSTAGNPTNSIVISNGTTLEFYSNDLANAYLNKQVVLQDGGNIQNGSGISTIAGPLVLTNVNGSANCNFKLGGTSVNLSNTVSGNGVLVLASGSTGTLVFGGNGSAFTGGAAIIAGTFDLTGTMDGGITNQANSTVEGTGTATGTLDISGNLIPGTATTPGTLTAGGLVLEGGSTPTFNLSWLTTTGKGVNSFIQVNGNVAFNNSVININPLGQLANGAPYTLMACSSFSGTLPTPQTVQASSYALTLTNVTTSSNVLIQLISLGGPTNSPSFGAIAYSASSGSLVLSGSNGIPGQTFYVLATTNLALPLTNWAVLSTNSFDVNGNFALTNAVGTNKAEQFFELYDGPTPVP